MISTDFHGWRIEYERPAAAHPNHDIDSLNPLTQFKQPSYPLSLEQFRNAIAVGHGRAWVQIASHGSDDFRDEVLGTAQTWYDGYKDGLGAVWLARICEQSGVVSDYSAASESEEATHRGLRGELMKEFARMGYEEARTALYQLCKRRDDKTQSIFACGEIIELDGEQGLLFVSRVLGQRSLDDPKFRVRDCEIEQFDEEHGEGRALAFLRAEAEHDIAVAKYLESVAANQQLGSSYAPRRRPVESVLAAIKLSERPQFWVFPWGRKASQEDLAEVLALALTTESDRALENALRCLSASEKLPLQLELMQFLTHSDDEVRFHCAIVLGHHIDSRVRTAGLAMVEQDPRAGLQLLRKNAEAEDADSIAKALPFGGDADTRHGRVMSVVELLQGAPDFVDAGLALYVYEESPCAECRFEAVKYLVERKLAPAWLIEEARYDGNEDTRKLLGFEDDEN